ncbi:MAG: hypothetical protein KF774_13800 [Planctomyces sp.]|nr:hypothetical protein [Planctomyces sp.]
MAREEADREDLWAEASALSPRLELRLKGGAEPVVAGLRPATGGWSVYFGPDPAYHFDRSGALRRAFVSDNLYRTQGETLARLTRRRTPDRVELLRSDLPPAELEGFLRQAEERLRDLHAALVAGVADILRRHPADGDGVPQLRQALEDILAAPLRLAPAISPRR